MSRFMSMWAMLALFLMACLTSSGGSPVNPGDRPASQVSRESVKFGTRQSDGKMYTIGGAYNYAADQKPSGGTLIVALHGAGYNSNYFMVPVINDAHYSFAEAMVNGDVTVASSQLVKRDSTAYGVALPVLALDDFGTGRSSPIGGMDAGGDLLSIEESVVGLNQVLSGLKTPGNPLNTRFKNIIVLCHSKGCAVAIKALSIAPGAADALVVTGFAMTPHAIPNPPLTQEVVTNLQKDFWVKYPSDLRGALFFAPNDVDSAVVSYDATSLSDVVGRLQLQQMGSYFQDGPKALGPERISVPVLLILSDKDLLYPAYLGPQDVPLYATSPKVEMYNARVAGHSLFLHRSSGETFAQIAAWIARSVSTN